MKKLWQAALLVLVLASLDCGATPGDTAVVREDASTPDAVAAAGALASAMATHEDGTQSMTKQFLVKTNKGEFTLELDVAKAPKTCANFEHYVSTGHYNGTIFHRVIKGFMIQGGGMDSLMAERATIAPIENEASNGLKNLRGTVAMARTNAVHSATSQFFINVVDNDFLNFRSPDPQGFGYCVFGKVASGMDVVDVIRNVPTGSLGMHKDVPNQAVMIESISLVP